MKLVGLLALLFLLVLATRAPFVGAGYGAHADNWRVAVAARHIAQTGAYEASRLPGYPVQEYVCSLFWRAGAAGFNWLDAFFCAAGAVFFALICREYRMRDWWLAGLALAFVPVLYVNSVSSKDFPWALALLLAAWWGALRKKPALTGLLLGLAMGTRITSGAAALPLALILSEGADNRAALRRVLTTGVISAAIVLTAFAPVYARYGSDFFNFYAEHAFPGPMQIAARMTIEVWGLLGFAGVCLAFLASPLVKERPPVSSRQIMAWAAMLVIYIAAFLCLPDEAAYLLPAAPFIILLLWWAAPRWAFLSCCALVVVSPFIGWPPGYNGQIVQDHHARIATDHDVFEFLRYAALASGSNAYITGGWQPEIDCRTADEPLPNAKFSYLLTASELDALRAKGWQVWYLPRMREFEYRVYKYDIRQHGARDIRELAEATSGATRR